MVESAVVHPVDVDFAQHSLIGARLWNRLVARIMADLEFQVAFGREVAAAQRRWAERILDEALAFLVLCARGEDGPYSPSALVDIGWHNFLMFTRDYEQFCDRHAGRFIHHEPTESEGVDDSASRAAHTVAGMRALGMVVDTELWPSETGGKCYSCSDGGCRSQA